jgi:hypothetical protein
MRITSTAVWPHLARYVHRSISCGRTSLELRDVLDPALVQAALATTVPCCACGTEMHPFRLRKIDALRGVDARPAKSLFIAVTCTAHDQRTSCHQTKAARDERERLVRWFDVEFPNLLAAETSELTL